MLSKNEQKRAINPLDVHVPWRDEPLTRAELQAVARGGVLDLLQIHQLMRQHSPTWIMRLAVAVSLDAHWERIDAMGLPRYLKGRVFDCLMRRYNEFIVWTATGQPIGAPKHRGRARA